MLYIGVPIHTLTRPPPHTYVQCTLYTHIHTPSYSHHPQSGFYIYPYPIHTPHLHISSSPPHTRTYIDGETDAEVISE